MNGHMARRNGYLVPSGRTFCASIPVRRGEGGEEGRLFQFRTSERVDDNEDGYRGARSSAAPGRCLLPLPVLFAALSGKLPVPVSRYSWSVVIHPA